MIDCKGKISSVVVVLTIIIRREKKKRKRNERKCSVQVKRVCKDTVN